MDAVKAGVLALLSGDAAPVALTAASLGVAFHVLILRTLEVEGFMYNLIGSGIVTVVTLIAAHLSLGFGVVSAGFRVWLIATSFNVAVLLSMVVYRIFFHRLNHFPGPFPAKVTRFYSAYKVSQSLRYFEIVTGWKEKYGDFVRTGPREIAVFRKSAVAQIFGPDSKCRKATWYGQVDMDPKNASIHMTRDYDQHKKRRRAWDRGFSIKALSGYEPLISGKVDQLIGQINERETLDATAWSMFLSFDIMGKVGFGKDFNSVVTGEEHAAIQGIHSSMNVLGVMCHVPWLLNLMGRIPGAAAAYQEFFSWCGSEIEAQKKDWNPEKDPETIVAWLLKAFMGQEISASPSLAALHEDSRVVIVAGSETTATTLTCILFYLAKYPEIQRKLQSQLDTALGGQDAAWDYEKVKTVSLIDDIIHETLRHKPAVPSGGPRVTPPEGITIDGTFIPGDTNVFVPVQPIQRDPRYWEKAEEFIPERFGEKRAEMNTDGTPYMPFNLGAYLCPGKGLAFMSLRIAMSRLMREFDVAFAPGEDGEKFDKELKDTFTTSLSPVMVSFTKRA